jgi:uncharacterized protein (TIGR02391 family)
LAGLAAFVTAGLVRFLMAQVHTALSSATRHPGRGATVSFLQGNYLHAVFEACKAYNLLVKQKAQSAKDGAPLMLEVWGCEKGVLKITPCASQTDMDVQDGIKFLAAGLMQAIRNPTAHEPAILWPISKQDCLDILSLVSFLFRQHDKAVYFKA